MSKQPAQNDQEQQSEQDRRDQRNEQHQQDQQDRIVLEARSVTKHFPVRRTGRDLVAGRRRTVHAVDDVSLELRRGTVTALVGSRAPGSPPWPDCSPGSIP